MVTPIQKTKESIELTNFRPISVLPVLSKVLERVVYDQLMSYLLNHNLLYERQSGFRPHYSTQDVLLHVTDSWRRAIDESEFTAAAFLDISKAFDCINHDILLSKLVCHGVLERSLVWFTTYLSCRKQQVCMWDLSSMWGEIHVGVPQGSILGPLLFSIYMNDLSNVVQICELNLYADDMKMHCSNANLASAEHDLQRDIQSVNSWLCVNLLTLSIRKSNVMLIGSHQKLTCVLLLMASSFPVCLQSGILVFILMKICHGISIQQVLFKELTLGYIILTVYVPCLLTFLLNYIVFLCCPYWIIAT